MARLPVLTPEQVGALRRLNDQLQPKPEQAEALRHQLQASPALVRWLLKHKPSAALLQQWVEDQSQPAAAPKQSPWSPLAPAPGKRLSKQRELAEFLLHRRLEAGNVPNPVTPTVVRGWLVDDWEPEIRKQGIKPKPTVPDRETVRRWWFPKAPQ
jgi:hypothetical protein